VWPAIQRRALPSAPALAVGATVLLYALGSLLALARRPQDPRVSLYVATGVLVTLSILLPKPDLAMRPRGLLFAATVFYQSVFLMNFAVFVHLAAMIPRRNPIVVRHPRLLPGNYAAGAAMAVLAAAGSLFLVVPAFPWRLSLAVFRTVNGLSYLYAGVLGLLLLRHAALHEETAVGRRQALIVFFGLLPWTINLAGWLVLPAPLYPFSFFRSVEPFVILLVPASFALAILRYRLFGVGIVVRKGLIYGLTAGLVAGAVALVEAFGATAAGRGMGAHFGSWSSALLLILAGAALGPVLHRVTHAVDSLFFPEKVEIRRLESSIIPDLAGYAGIDHAASRLVQWLAEGLGLKNASLLIADEGQGFYRVRAQAGEFDQIRAREAVITRQDLAEGLAKGRRPAEAEGELGRMLALLEAQEVIPVEFNGQLVGILILGPSRAATEFDREDLHRLEEVARRASAMLENARLYDLATKDPLTSLPRRQVFEERLAQELQRYRRTLEPLAIGLADIDGFKWINDTLGHLAGDQALRAIAAALSAEIRKSDLVARYGGEEFAFLFTQADREGAVHIAESLRRRVEETAADVEGGRTITVTISVGLHIVRPDDAASSAEDLVRFADRALYEAKRLGKNRVAVYG
jgi:diguanylate cyclase (GGDEF)-like protein